MSAFAFGEAPRLLNGALARIERRVLVWIAVRLPRAINSDHLTALALTSMLAAGAGYAAARAHPGALVFVDLCLAFNWFGDSLDGTLARVRNQPRPRFGFYVDHAVDCVGAAALLGGLALSGFASPSVALAILAAYLLLSAEIYLATYCVGTFRISYFGVGPTELRLLVALGNLALLRHPIIRVFGNTVRLYNVGGVAAIAGMAMTATLSMVRNARALAAMDPRPSGGAGPTSSATGHRTAVAGARTCDGAR